MAKIPVLHMGNRSIERTLRRSYDDLGALRIEDPNHPDRVVVAAGAPWLMTLFGRDSLWASVMAMPVAVTDLGHATDAVGPPGQRRGSHERGGAG
ncbi:hypothetical protein GCM10023063_26130 [Arthrobacter methylotrophus]